MSQHNYIDLTQRAIRAAAECIATTRKDNHDEQFKHSVVTVNVVMDLQSLTISVIPLTGLNAESLSDIVREFAPARYRSIELSGWSVSTDDGELYEGWEVSTNDERSTTEREGILRQIPTYGVETLSVTESITLGGEA